MCNRTLLQPICPYVSRNHNEVLQYVELQERTSLFVCFELTAKYTWTTRDQICQIIRHLQLQITRRDRFPPLLLFLAMDPKARRSQAVGELLCPKLEWNEKVWTLHQVPLQLS